MQVHLKASDMSRQACGRQRVSRYNAALAVEFIQFNETRLISNC